MLKRWPTQSGHILNVKISLVGRLTFACLYSSVTSLMHVALLYR